MEFAEYKLENKDQFWEELDHLLSRQVYSSSAIEPAVVAFLRYVSTYMGEYLTADPDLLNCCYKFIDCPAFVKHRIQVRRILIDSLVQNYEQLPTQISLLIGVLLLVDGRQHTDTFQMMGEENSCPVVIELLWHRKDEEPRVHPCFLELLYEMCRVQRLQSSDLEAIPVEFVEYLFACVESNEDYDSDPFSYSFIRIILVLNEQYMLLNNSAKAASQPVLENQIVNILSEKGNIYKTFGTNIIILLNREQEPSLQLLILKMLYQLFMHEATQEYFYTNDLTVLVDVFIRDLNDIPDDAETLRQTFLRVLHPLLAYTQLRQTHYKRNELVKLLQSLSGQSKLRHYLPVSETTKRLVSRCMKVSWI
ncbi:uncharacterized protein V2V93DRAFT_310843, partial [Kockiozyma suomiensis]|uniref:uncharacterized protein n=1 Tax=Kockiozyma suomiensis TaxID=1337062 RepID=UPI0033431CB6